MNPNLIQHQPKTENNLIFKPETRPEYSHTHPKPIGLGRVPAQPYLEDPLHALWTCTKLDVVWADFELWDFRSQTQLQDFKQLKAWVLMHAKNPELFATIA